MRYIIVLIGCSFLFTGCITMITLDRAKQDRMPERVKTVLTSYKDTSGYAVVVYKKRYRKSLYKAVLPLDTILSIYKAADKEDFLNRDSTLENFEGVFTMRDARNKKEQQRIILFNNETPLTDTTGLQKEIARNEHIVEKHKGKTNIPVGNYVTKTKAASFTVKTGNNEKVLVTFQPQRHNNIRYLLVPLTVGVDAVSWPIQLVVGLIFLSKVPIS